MTFISFPIKISIKTAAILLIVFVFWLPCWSAQGAEDNPTPSPTTEPPQLKQTQSELTQKQEELSELTEKINALKNKYKTATNEAELAADQLKRISSQVELAELQLEETQLNISDTQQQSEQITADMQYLEELVASKRQQLSQTLRSLYECEQKTTALNILLGSDTLSAFLVNQEVHRDLTSKTYELVQNLRQQRQELEKYQNELQEKNEELQSLYKLQAAQHTTLNNTRQEKKNFLDLKKQEQANYETKISEAVQARQEIENDIFTLKNVGLQLAANDAFQAARYASNLTGVKPSLLLAVVKIESNVGEWTGSGKFPDDMLPSSRDAFLRLTSKLGLDPYTTPVSRRPTSLQGWGGAIGPGQIMPDTWERLEARVAALMGKPQPNPFDLPDSLVAIGIMLADRGATNESKQLEAVCRYLAGPNWQYHAWYGNKVLAVAKEYEASGL